MVSLNWGIIGHGKIAHDFARDLGLVQPAQKITTVTGVQEKSTNDFVKEFAAGTPFNDPEKFIRRRYPEAMRIRFLPGIEKMLSSIKQGPTGKLVRIKASMSFKPPKDEGSYYFNPEPGGSSLRDLCVYPVFPAHLLLVKRKTIKANSLLTDKGIDESCSMLLEYRQCAGYTRFHTRITIRSPG